MTIFSYILKGIKIIGGILFLIGVTFLFYSLFSFNHIVGNTQTSEMVFEEYLQVDIIEYRNNDEIYVDINSEQSEKRLLAIAFSLFDQYKKRINLFVVNRNILIVVSKNEKAIITIVN